MESMKLKQMLSDHPDMPALDTSPVSKLFKPEEMPSYDETPVGRAKLIRALAQKYGANYRSKPEVASAMEHYDKEVKYLNLYKKVLGDRYGR